MQDKLDFGTVEAACAEIGGDKPIHRTTYYRGVKGRHLPGAGASVTRHRSREHAQAPRGDQKPHRRRCLMTNAPTEVGALAKEHSDSDTNRISTSPRGPQLTCECCLKQFPKTSKKPKRFCSDACRKKEARRRANGHSEVQSELRIADKAREAGVVFNGLTPPYDCICAEPPWRFSSNSLSKPGRNPCRHYACMHSCRHRRLTRCRTRRRRLCAVPMELAGRDSDVARAASHRSIDRS